MAKGRKTVTRKVKIVRQTPKEYDEQLVEMMGTMRDAVKTGMKLPDEFQCTNIKCKSTNIEPHGTRTGKIVGIKPVFKCKDCKNVFVVDNDMYRNVYFKLVATQAVAFGTTEDVKQAYLLLKEYGVDVQNSPTFRYIENMLTSKQVPDG